VAFLFTGANGCACIEANNSIKKITVIIFIFPGL